MMKIAVTDRCARPRGAGELDPSATPRLVGCALIASVAIDSPELASTQLQGRSRRPPGLAEDWTPEPPSSPPEAHTGRRRSRLFAAAALGVLAVGLLASPKATVAPPLAIPAIPSNVPLPRPPASAHVAPPDAIVVLEVVPHTAVLTVDGRPISNPFSGRLASGKPVRLVARAPGYVTDDRSFVPDPDTSLVIQLVPTRAAPRTAAIGSACGGASEARPSVPPPFASTAPATAPEVNATSKPHDQKKPPPFELRDSFFGHGADTLGRNVRPLLSSVARGRDEPHRDGRPCAPGAPRCPASARARRRAHVRVHVRRRHSGSSVPGARERTRFRRRPEWPSSHAWSTVSWRSPRRHPAATDADARRPLSVALSRYLADNAIDDARIQTMRRLLENRDGSK